MSPYDHYADHKSAYTAYEGITPSQDPRSILVREAPPIDYFSPDYKADWRKRMVKVMDQHKIATEKPGPLRHFKK